MIDNKDKNMAVKILSVDDEQDLELLLTHYFRRKIRKGEYEFSFAHNGLEALQIMVEHPDFDIILSDINMPEMDGLTLLSKINEKRNLAQKCIMVSAYGDMKNIRTAMNRGAFDFSTKPIDMDDLSLTIEKAVAEIQYIKERQKEHSQLQALNSDMEVAAEIQRAILPTEFPPFPELADRVDIYASMTPAKMVGGDFYDFFPIDEHRIGFIIADVSGKGVPAALFMAISDPLIRSVALSTHNSSECINSSNILLCRASVDSMFLTALYGIYDLETGNIDFTNAGHNATYVLRNNGQVEKIAQHSNFVLGGFDDFKYTSDSVHLEPGESIVLYTDGITEAFNGNNEEFGAERLEASLDSLDQESAQGIVEQVLRKTKDFVGDTEQSDDITMLVVKRLNK